MKARMIDRKTWLRLGRSAVSMRHVRLVLTVVLLGASGAAAADMVTGVAPMARTAAKSWQDDAILVEVNAVARPDGTLLTGALFTFLSPSTRRGLTVSIGGGRVMRMQVPVGPATLPIPEWFIDLTDAVTAARNGGFGGTLSGANLQVYATDTGNRVAWKLGGMSTHSSASSEVFVDAIAGTVTTLGIAPTVAEAAQEGDPYLFAWMEVSAIDRNGHPVIDPNTHRQITDSFCFAWKTGWLTDYGRSEVQGKKFWWSAVSYTVDPRARQVTVHRAWGPNVVATPAGPRPAGRPDVIAFRIGRTVPMFDRPQPGWPCTQETWATVMRERKVLIWTPAPPGGSSGSNSPGGTFCADSNGRHGQTDGWGVCRVH